jgi:cold shock CspA family protein
MVSSPSAMSRYDDDRREPPSERERERDYAPKGGGGGNGKQTGKAMRWNERGFGFIKDNADESKEYYVHFTGLQVEEGGFKSLQEGQQVEFDLTVQGDEPVEMRAFLRLGDKVLSETWLYQYHPFG